MMKDIIPDFKDIKSFEEFNIYYWYREELSQICKSLGLEYRCTKKELNLIIEQFFKGNRVEKSVRKVNKNQTELINLNTPLLECGFSFNQKFRDYFSAVTGVNLFKFNADMATAWRKVKAENDLSFTIQDMLKVYYGESDYAKYDCLDECSNNYSDKLKAAATLWKEVRDSKNEKVYSRELLKNIETK